jgi:hypothetical protein
MDNNIKTPNEIISQLVEENRLPNGNDFLNNFYDDSGIFTAQESDMFDYKEVYPFSNSDDLFASIIRLICALHNTYGGMIIFGVHDKERTAGKNSVIVDDEKINRKLRETLTRPLLITCKKYTTPSGDIDILLVPKREQKPPIHFSKIIGKYQPFNIFYRQGSEVLLASGNEIDMLYGLRINPYIDETNKHSLTIQSGLPASPSTIGNIIGRFEVLEGIFNWLQVSKEPRFFLWGDGGSGKSTIAYEAGRVLTLIGKSILNKYNYSFEGVIYLSAKKKYLDSETSKIKKFRGTDFETSLDLFKSILILSDFGDSNEINNYDEDKCLKELENLFDAQAQLIIIDDIDTLISDDIDAGMEELHSIGARCKSGSKILYTLRKIPSFARKNSMEVPGFRKEDEYPEFLNLCSEHFNVPSPSNDEANDIYNFSEARPLAIETMLGLRRITSDYKSAIDRWKSEKSDALDYLFRKEYNSLTSSRSKNLLATLVAFNTSQTQDTLTTILNCSEDQIQDAISEVREMFLRVEIDDISGETKYSFRSATRVFLSTVSKELDYYTDIKARVEFFQRESSQIPPPVITIINRAKRSRQRGETKEAWALLTNKSFPKAMTEHPSYKAELGLTAAEMKPPLLTEAREYFEDAYKFGHRDYEMFGSWVTMEQEADTGTSLGIDVCNKVIGDAKFSTKTKATMRNKLAYLEFTKCRLLEESSPDESSDLRKSFIYNNLIAFKEADSIDMKNLNIFQSKAIAAISKLSIFCGNWLPCSEYGVMIEKILIENVPVSFLCNEILSSLNSLLKRVSDEEQRRITNFMHRILGKLKNTEIGNFNNETDRKDFINNLTKITIKYHK